jgi:hypothetical protein
MGDLEVYSRLSSVLVTLTTLEIASVLLGN